MRWTGGNCRTAADLLPASLLALAALLASGTADATCKPANGTGPAIGLALSGGGARGSAHIGVLRVFEELQIPIGCIAGTSVGALVGGSYAAGLSPDEIEREMRTTDWEQLFQGEPPRRSLSFRRKEDDLRYFDFEAGLRDGKLILPRGAAASPGMDFMLRSKTLHVAGIDDFDRLPIPFRAVAADLVTGEEVVLGRGELSRAIRASMSIPAIFAPVEIDGRLLVDGGVVNNLPIEVVKAMGADIIIAVNVGTPLLSRAQLGSLSDIAFQALALAMQRRIDQQKPLADVLIEPELGAMTMLDFYATPSGVSAGDVAARKATASLQKLSKPEAFANYLARQRRPDAPVEMLRSIHVEGTQRVDQRLVAGRVHSRAGEPLDVERLSRDLGRIVEIGEFERVDFDFVRGDDGVDLAIRPQDNSWGPTYLRAGMAITDDFEGHNSFAALFNLTRTSLNALGAEWRNEIQLGRTRRLYSEWYQPLDFGGRWFAATRAEYGRSLTDVIDDNHEKIAEYDIEYVFGALDLGLQLAEYGEARIGLRRGEANAGTSIGATELPELSATIAGVTGRLVLDRVDSPSVPREGSLLELDVFHSEPGLGADQSYERLAASYWLFGTVGRHTMFWGMEGGTSFGADLPPYDEFSLGGLFSLSGYVENELSGDYFGVVRPGYLYRLLDPVQRLASAFYVGGWLEAGNVWEDSEAIGDDLIYTATLALAADTKFGALYLAFGVADDGQQSLVMRLGQRF
jgi:NTE family protein